MSVSTTSTDPVQTLVDILDGTAASTWDTQPTYIEERWKTTFDKKANRQPLSVYVHSPERGTQDAFGRDIDTKIQDETIDVEVWASNDAAQAQTTAGDVISILEDYWLEGKTNTEWNRIQPGEADDRRAEALQRRADHFIVSVRVTLEREGSMGT